jgi:hypothetical protein
VGGYILRKGEKAHCHLGGNSILGRFFRGGKDEPKTSFPRGNYVPGPSFRGGGNLTQARFSGGGSLCGGKVYATTPQTKGLLCTVDRENLTI